MEVPYVPSSYYHEQGAQATHARRFLPLTYIAGCQSDAPSLADIEEAVWALLTLSIYSEVSVEPNVTLMSLVLP